MNKLLIALFLSISLSACASHYGAAKIVSVPEGAEVIADDGTLLGVTPQTVWWKDKSAHRQQMILRFKKDGYLEKVSSFWLSMRHSSQKKAMNEPQLVEVALDKDE